MATCLVCKERGWFLTLDQLGLCSPCSHEHSAQISRACDDTLHALKRLELSTKVETRLKHIALATSNLEFLTKYDELGVPTLTTSPEQLLGQLASMERALVSSEIDSLTFSAKEKSKDASTPAAKLSPYSSAVTKLQGLMDLTRDVYDIELAIENMRLERDQVRIDEFLKKAKTWEAKGNLKKAKETLIEALVEIEHDTTSDHLQEHTVAEIGRQIARLERQLT